jgi:hypothetical protein
VNTGFAENVPGDEYIDLLVRPVPASFRLEHISRADFAEGMKRASYSQLISDLYECPAELDSRPLAGKEN